MLPLAILITTSTVRCHMISLAEKSPNLIHEWSERNLPLSPETISYGSHRMVWWKGSCGHEWQAVVKSRSIGRQTGCPYCSGNRVLKGFNDFATRYPEIASEWSEKNAPFTPDQFSAFSNRKMWWKGKCGHEWQALIADRSSGHGCPYCNTHKRLKGFNDFATSHPLLVKEWAKENGEVQPDALPSYHYLAYWKCSACGNTYRAWTDSRANGSKCPYCTNRSVLKGFNDLATTYPDLAEEWEPKLNDPLRPTDLTASSCTRVWWKGKCGHTWKASVSDRTVRHVRCYKCEAEFLYNLPRILFLLYAKRSSVAIQFESEILSGFICTAFIEDVNAIIDIVPSSPRERSVKEHICASQGIKYISYARQKTIERTISECQRIFRDLNLFFRADSAADIQTARQIYDRASGNS